MLDRGFNVHNAGHDEDELDQRKKSRAQALVATGAATTITLEETA